MAVLPTPASPSSTGLFLVRRQSIWMTRSISFLRPMTGSSLAFARQFGQVAAERAQRRGLDFASSAWPRANRQRLRFLLGFGRGEIRVEFLEDFVAGALDIDFEILEHAGGDAFAFAEQAEQDVLGADVGMVERLGFLAGERQDFLDARSVGNVADHLGLGTGADLFLDLHADGFQIEPHFLEDVDRHALAELDQAEQQVLGADVIVVEPVGLLAGQCQYLLSSRSKIIHHLFLLLPLPVSGTVPYVRFWKLFQFLTDNPRAQRIPFFNLQFLLRALLQMGRLGFHEEFVDHGAVAVRKKAEIDAELHEGEQVERLLGCHRVGVGQDAVGASDLVQQGAESFLKQQSAGRSARAR